MGRIYFNLNNEKINYLEEDKVNNYDMLLSDMAGKMVLVSMNNVRTFDCFDLERKNESIIKQLIKVGYRPANKLMETLLTQSYNFCPCCGTDIDIERESKVLILDAGTSLVNLVNKNVYPAKELTCLKCGHMGLFYYDLYANNDEKNKFSERATQNGAEIFVLYKRIIDSGSRNANIPIIFDFSQFLMFFNSIDGVSDNENKKETDFVSTLKKDDDKNIIGMLFNRELQAIVQTDDNILVDNMKVELRPVEIGSYDKYVTKNDYENIKLYNSIGDNQELLLELIMG